MAQAQIPNGMYQERTALLDRIKSFETITRRSHSRPAGAGDVTPEEIAYAMARLERITIMIENTEQRSLA
jgi:hypothetical protein